MTEISTDAAINSVLAAKQSALNSQIGTAVAKKSLDAQQAAGDAVNQLLQQAANLSKALGRGENLDTLA